MYRRNFIKASALAAAAPAVCAPSNDTPPSLCARGTGGTVVWKAMLARPAHVLALDGHTDTVPDVVGRIGVAIDLCIFTEGNHFPVLLGEEIMGSFRTWAREHARWRAVPLDNIVVVTLPQPMIVAAISGEAIAFGNLTLVVNRASGFYPDLVMGGAEPLKALRHAAVVEGQAKVFARNRGMALLVRAGNPLGIAGTDDLARADVRIVMASAAEPGARALYTASLEARLGQKELASVLARETVAFPGRLDIQHRDVLQALVGGHADVGIIFRHLAHHFSVAYPESCAMVTIPGADAYASTIAIAETKKPLRPQATQAFSEFFLDVARTVYPKYEFAHLSEAEFASPISLD
jgi:ABC-type molybdate transport system substrate-binding protein